MTKVCVIGGAGHVGLPFSLILSEVEDFEVVVIDVDETKINNLKNGIMPYKENRVNALKDYNVTYSNRFYHLNDADVIVVMIGTPVDEEGNGRIDNILDLFVNTIEPPIAMETYGKPPLIILRSTVMPGTTDIIRNRLHQDHNLINDRDYHLVFAPERVSQGNSMIETGTLPQLIGAYSEKSYKIAANFFTKFNTGKKIHLTPKEAEFGKLLTNMYRYVTFALANEFYMIGTDLNLNTHKVIDAVNIDYDRMNLPLPGPNVGGPCLHKDGKFLIEDIPYGDLINVSYHINEGMPNYILKNIDFISLNRVAIFGMTFKAESDDIRNSLSFKMKKLLKSKGVSDIICYDPYWIDSDPFPNNFDNIDAIIIMTPHKVFKTLFESQNIIEKLPLDAIIIDPWKLLDESKGSKSGIYSK
ncbi:MAG: nucleotide sugar dehydrogenase [Candidatus Paceibacterota bacterium]